jgi:hypothetical protein
MLLLPVCFDKQRIAEIVVVQMERRLIVSISVGLDDLPIGDLRILYKDIGTGYSLSICAADESFDSESMIGFMRGRADGWKGGSQAHDD